MLYSKSAKYAIKSLTSLVGLSQDQYRTAGEVAECQEVPADFLSKIFQRLAKEGLLDSQKGRGGGFRLERPAEEISLLEIVHAVDGEDVFHRCPFDTRNCDPKEPCPLHQDWKPIRDQIVGFLEQKKISDLVQE